MSAMVFSRMPDARVLSEQQRSLYRYLTAHRDGARYPAAIDGWYTAGPFITATGEPFLPMGGSAVRYRSRPWRRYGGRWRPGNCGTSC